MAVIIDIEACTSRVAFLKHFSVELCSIETAVGFLILQLLQFTVVQLCPTDLTFFVSISIQ